MSKIKSVLGALGLGAPKIPPMPVPEIPAPPAPVRREDTGASIIVGSDEVKNERVSGRRRNRDSGLAGLGRGSGLNI